MTAIADLDLIRGALADKPEALAEFEKHVGNDRDAMGYALAANIGPIRVQAIEAQASEPLRAALEDIETLWARGFKEASWGHGRACNIFTRAEPGKGCTCVFGPLNKLIGDAALAASREETPERPRIVCLCGSTRFYEEFQQANYDETMAGRIVLSVGFYPHAKAKHGHGEGVGHDSSEKVALDELHKRKIDLADEVLVLNVGGYIGESTRSEIDYAIAHGKPVRYLAASKEERPDGPR